MNIPPRDYHDPRQLPQLTAPTSETHLTHLLAAFAAGLLTSTTIIILVITLN